MPIFIFKNKDDCIPAYFAFEEKSENNSSGLEDLQNELKKLSLGEGDSSIIQELDLTEESANKKNSIMATNHPILKKKITQRKNGGQKMKGKHSRQRKGIESAHSGRIDSKMKKVISS